MASQFDRTARRPRDRRRRRSSTPRPGATRATRGPRSCATATEAGATATYHARVDVAGFGTFDWDGTLTLLRVKQAKQTVWRIQWRPPTSIPGLAAGQRLTLQRTWPSRAAIVAADGSLLAGSQKVVEIGLEPDRIAKTLPKIKKLMQSLVGTDPQSIDAALHGPGVRPNYFVRIATVPDDTRYHDVLRPKLAPDRGRVLPAPRGCARAARRCSAQQLVGSVGEITADRLKQLGPPYRVGDQVGLGGLQSVFESRLAGRPTGAVVIESGVEGRAHGEDVRGTAPAVGDPHDRPAHPAGGRLGAGRRDAAGGARRDRRAHRPDPRDRVEARQRVRPCARRQVPARLDVQGDHLDRVARRRAHRRRRRRRARRR